MPSKCCTIFKVVGLLFFSHYTQLSGVPFIVAAVCTLHDGSATGGHTLHNISTGRIADNFVWSTNYVLQPNTQTQEVMQEIM